MDRDTFTGAMRAFRNQTPFRPFTVAMVKGDRFEVDHPEALRDGLARPTGGRPKEPERRRNHRLFVSQSC